MISVSKARWNDEGEFVVNDEIIKNYEGTEISNTILNKSLYVKFEWTSEDLNEKGIKNVRIFFALVIDRDGVNSYCDNYLVKIEVRKESSSKRKMICNTIFNMTQFDFRKESESLMEYISKEKEENVINYNINFKLSSYTNESEVRLFKIDLESFIIIPEPIKPLDFSIILGTFVIIGIILLGVILGVKGKRKPKTKYIPPIIISKVKKNYKPLDYVEVKEEIVDCKLCGKSNSTKNTHCIYCGNKLEFIKKEVIEKRARYIKENVKRDVWRRDKGKCVECGSKEKLEFDHIIPISKGGSNTARNIQLLCEKCNRKKSNLI